MLQNASMSGDDVEGKEEEKRREGGWCVIGCHVLLSTLGLGDPGGPADRACTL